MSIVFKIEKNPVAFYKYFCKDKFQFFRNSNNFFHVAKSILVFSAISQIILLYFKQKLWLLFSNNQKTLLNTHFSLSLSFSIKKTRNTQSSLLRIYHHIQYFSCRNYSKSVWKIIVKHLSKEPNVKQMTTISNSLEARSGVQPKCLRRMRIVVSSCKSVIMKNNVWWIERSWAIRDADGKNRTQYNLPYTYIYFSYE